MCTGGREGDEENYALPFPITASLLMKFFPQNPHFGINPLPKCLTSAHYWWIFFPSQLAAVRKNVSMRTISLSFSCINEGRTLNFYYRFHLLFPFKRNSKASNITTQSFWSLFLLPFVNKLHAQRKVLHFLFFLIAEEISFEMPSIIIRPTTNWYETLIR